MNNTILFGLAAASVLAAQQDTQTERDTFYVAKASDVVGCELVNPAEDELGDIDDLVVTPDGRIAYAVVSCGGFLGIGDKLLAMPWDCIGATQMIDEEKSPFVVRVSRERLEAAPGFDPDNWPVAANTAWCGEIDRYYAADLRDDMDSRAVNASMARPEYVLRCTELNGLDVYDRESETVGEIAELVLDPIHGRVAYAVLSCGGFMGIGDTMVAVPFGAFEQTLDEDNNVRLVLDVTKERLEQAPRFSDESEDWDRMGNRDWIRNEVYAFFGQKPYWTELPESLKNEGQG